MSMLSVFVPAKVPHEQFVQCCLSVLCVLLDPSLCGPGTLTKAVVEDQVVLVVTDAGGLLELVQAGLRPDMFVKAICNVIELVVPTLCYAVVLPGLKSAFRAGFRPDCYRESSRPKAGRRADFCVFLVVVRPKSGPEGRLAVRRHYFVT